MRLKIKVLLLTAAIHVSGCTALSSALGITHTETITANGNLLIVTSDKSFQGWLKFAKSLQVTSQKIISLTQDKAIFIADKDANKIVMITLLDYSPDLCAAAEEAKEKGPIWSLLTSSSMRATNINEPSLANCKRAQQTAYSIKLTDYGQTYSDSATAIIDIEYKNERSFKYRSVGLKCHDGSISSASGRGACSWHGGVSGLAYERAYIQKEAHNK